MHNVIGNYKPSDGHRQLGHSARLAHYQAFLVKKGIREEIRGIFRTYCQNPTYLN
jgi:hypothetical protein